MMAGKDQPGATNISFGQDYKPGGVPWEAVNRLAQHYDIDFQQAELALFVSYDHCIPYSLTPPSNDENRLENIFRPC